MDGLSDARKKESDASITQNKGFSFESIFGQRYSLQIPSHEIDSSGNSEGPIDSLSYFIEKLKGYFKILLTQENYQNGKSEGISDEEIVEILGIERSDLDSLKNLISHTEKFLNIIRNPDFISLLRSRDKKEA